MSHFPVEYLRHILDEIEFLSARTADLTREQLLEDPSQQVEHIIEKDNP